MENKKNIIEEMAKLIDDKGLKLVFGLEAQGHIPTIEKIISHWNETHNKEFPDEEIDTIDYKYSKFVWEIIGKEIGWCPFTAALYYFKHLDKNK